MQGATVFSTFDFLSAYHQIRLTDEDIPKSAFRTPTSLYEYKVMPFGLPNAPSVFMAAMNDILSEMGFAAVNLDDILIFSRTPEEHVNEANLSIAAEMIACLVALEWRIRYWPSDIEVVIDSVVWKW
jgi:hypothetical protein